MIRFFILLFLLIQHQAQSQFYPEISTVKRNTSLGEKSGFKLLLPDQSTHHVEKITTNYFKFIATESAKPAKGFKEIIHRRVFVKNWTEPLIVIAYIEQQGNHVGWYGYFFNEKDSQNLLPNDTLKSFVHHIYKLSMISIYEDSIYYQNKALNTALNNLDDMKSEKTKNEHSIAKSKKDITNAEADMNHYEADIEKLNLAAISLRDSIKSAEFNLSESKKDITRIEKLENEIEDLKSNEKIITKEIKDLQKNLALNTNLISSKSNDLLTLSGVIKQKQDVYDLNYKLVKSYHKRCEKNLESNLDKLKENEKSVKKFKEKIIDAKEEIKNNKNTITESEARINKIDSVEMDKITAIAKSEQSKLDLLKVAQFQYR